MGMPEFNTAFVVWRESIEALLVIGILSAWIGHRPEAERKAGRAWLWAGVAVGIVGAVALAAALVTVGEELSDDAQVWFQTAIVLIAAALIVQMVFWMRRHGRTLKRELHARLDDAADRSNWIAVFTLAAIAVMREGSEAAVFLYGSMVSAGTSVVRGVVAAALGLALAIATYGLLQAGARIVSWRAFFRVTEIMLLLLAGSLLLTGVDNLVSLGLVPQLSGRMWDTSRILTDSGALGGLVSALTGYRAKPVLVQLLALGGYWLLMIWLLRRPTWRTA
ncbi:high-affinity iron transporter [Roseiarcus fermentans]|uniref:High-affinity iron transporter n=1 Tax=Roseiarcus fermentans TaxID=1473586 RepID=A0A366FE39_9HYPH|nr:FTR1 family protein [Roseiarcus fermentans]RBP12210.1 high-affinity iron transporter [Roseiarcus fermentans]